MNSLVFNKGQGGIGTPLAGLDYVSGLLFYSGATLPTGFTSSDRIKIVYSVADAIALGITNASLGETKSTSTFAFSTKYTAGATHVFTCATIASTSPIASAATAGTLTLASFTAVTADAVSTTTSGDRLAAEINLGTPTHGFTAVNATGTVTITAPAGQGIFLNSGTPYVSTITGGGAGTLTQNVVAGIASDIDIMYYHISEYFRMQPKGKLYVGIYGTADATTFASVTLMQNYAAGEMRQIGIYQKTTAFASTQITTLQAILLANATASRPLSGLYQSEFSTFADVTNATNYPNLRLLAAPLVTCTLAQDGAGAGFKLWKATGKSIGSVGTCLGTVALAAVNEDIAWIDKFPLSNGVEMEVAAFANGQLFTALSTGTITNLDLYGYVFALKQIDFTGSYWNDSHTCTPITGDYAYIERNRTIDKSIRGMRFYLLPATGSTTYSNPDGTLTQGIVSYFETLAQKALDQMTAAGELSASKASINANQNVVATSTLTIVVQEIPTGVARNIIVNIGYTTAITN